MKVDVFSFVVMKYLLTSNFMLSFV